VAGSIQAGKDFPPTDRAGGQRRPPCPARRQRSIQVSQTARASSSQGQFQPLPQNCQNVAKRFGGLLPLPAQRRGERARGEGFLAIGPKGASSPRPSPPLRRGEGE